MHDLQAKPLSGQSPALVELQTLADAEMQRQFDEAYLVGVAVALIKDGEIICRSYGHDDLVAERKVDAERSLFRMGSSSKLLTGTAILQLVEAGKLDLAADINDYLPGRPIPATFPEPITLKHLLTHTAGFESNSFGFAIARDIHHETPLLENLLRHRPERIKRPAETFTEVDRIAYSNWGLALAGAIVGEVSGLGFETYVEQYIFAPLGMQRSSFREPLPEHLAADMSLGYSGDEHYTPAHFQPLKNIGPSGSLSCTVENMARFLRMQLQQGRGEHGQVLQPETVALMQSRQYGAHPQLSGMGLVWMEQQMNGRRLLTHGGRTPLFFTDLHILPEEGLGVLVAYNSNPPRDFNGALMRAIMDKYYPAERPKPAPATQGLARQAVGHYQASTTSESTWEKALRLLMSVKVEADEAGLVIPEEGLDEPVHWLESRDSPGIFRREDSDELLALLKDDNGNRWLYGLGIPTPMMALPVWRQRLPNAIGLGLSCLIFLLGAFSAGRLPAEAGSLANAAYAVSAINLGLLVLLISSLIRNPDAMLARLPWTLRGAQSLSLLSPIAALALSWHCLQAWPALPSSTALIFGLHSLLAIVFGGWLHYWRLLGFRQARRLFPR